MGAVYRGTAGWNAVEYALASDLIWPSRPHQPGSYKGRRGLLVLTAGVGSSAASCCAGWPAVLLREGRRRGRAGL